MRLIAALLLVLGLCCLGQQPYAQVPMTGAGKGTSGGFTPSCSQSSSYIARTSGMDTTHKTAADTLICGEVTDSIFSLSDAQYLLCIDTSSNAALNLVSSSFSLTVNGSPTFTANSGYVGAVGANLDTGFNASTAGGNYAQNSASAFIWSLTTFTSGTSYGGAIGNLAATNLASVFPHFSDNNFYWQAQSTNGGNAASSAHFFGYTRGSAVNGIGWQTTTGTGDGTNSSALDNSDFFLLKDTSSGSPRPFTGNLAYAWIGGNLSSAQEGNLYARVHTYMQTICGAS